MLNYCKVARSKKEICSYLGYRNLTFFTKKHLMPLILSGKLKMTIPDKPNSRLQKYIKA
ncbi:Fic family protein [Lacrimispora sp. 210928-DFI.3.58]|uniref:Fic family protein n=1 Tax=Lacrimispora sp. 210928-DFI.3.58 TaxID=2883214 RepID=UPI002FE6EE55